MGATSLKYFRAVSGFTKFLSTFTWSLFLASGSTRTEIMVRIWDRVKLKRKSFILELHSKQMAEISRSDSDLLIPTSLNYKFFCCSLIDGTYCNCGEGNAGHGMIGSCHRGDNWITFPFRPDFGHHVTSSHYAEETPAKPKDAVGQTKKYF